MIAVFGVLTSFQQSCFQSSRSRVAEFLWLVLTVLHKKLATSWLETMADLAFLHDPWFISLMPLNWDTKQGDDVGGAIDHGHTQRSPYTKLVKVKFSNILEATFPPFTVCECNDCHLCTKLLQCTQCCVPGLPCLCYICTTRALFMH